MSTLRDIINFAATGNAVELKNAFSELMADKVAEKIDSFRPEVAARMFDLQPQATVAAEEQVEEAKKPKLDPVGKEDGDVDNDGDKDKSDSYLLNRRKAISKAMKEDAEQVDEALGTMANIKAATKFGQSNISKMDREEKARKAAEAKEKEEKKEKKETKENVDLISLASSMMNSSLRDLMSEARRRGRPSKNAEEEDIEPIKVQLEKAVSLRGKKKVTFENGDEVEVPAEHAKKALQMNDSLRTSIEKGEHQKKLGASHASFKKAIGVE